MVGWADIVIAIIVIAAFVAGLVKGLMKEAIGLAAVLVGFIVASRTYVQVAAFLQKYIHEPVVTKFLGFILVFLAVFIVGALAAFLLSKLMVGPLKLVNHVLGGVFGLVEGMLICGVFIFALLVFPINKDALSNSRLAPYCYGLTKVMVNLIPKELKDQFKDAYENIKREIKEVDHGQKI
jgi:membrane protein required for colicin V production